MFRRDGKASNIATKIFTFVRMLRRKYFIDVFGPGGHLSCGDCFVQAVTGSPYLIKLRCMTSRHALAQAAASRALN